MGVTPNSQRPTRNPAITGVRSELPQPDDFYPQDEIQEISPISEVAISQSTGRPSSRHYWFNRSAQANPSEQLGLSSPNLRNLTKELIIPLLWVR